MTQGSLATRLRVLRARRGLSLTDAAELAGIQRQTLAKLERGGTRPHDVTLSKLAKGYGIDVEDLLEEPEETSPAPKAEAPQLTLEQFADHGIQPTSAEVATLNAKLKAFTELAQTGAEKTKFTIPEGPVDMTRVDLLIEYACMTGMLTREDLSILAYGVARELAAGRS
jgi:transcriptional regulator with XRE-family HTH domain